MKKPKIGGSEDAVSYPDIPMKRLPDGTYRNCAPDEEADLYLVMPYPLPKTIREGLQDAQNPTVKIEWCPDREL